MSDHELLVRTRRDPDAFGLFYRRYQGLVITFFLRRTAQPEVAADLTAETFAAALWAVHRDQDMPPDNPSAWLQAIARNKLIDSYRRGEVEAGARRRLGMAPLALDDDDLERIVELHGHERVLELARDLPEEQRDALWARVIDDRDYPEIARELRCSEVVVRKRVSRALHRLRTAMGAS